MKLTDIVRALSASAALLGASALHSQIPLEEQKVYPVSEDLIVQSDAERFSVNKQYIYETVAKLKYHLHFQQNVDQNSVTLMFDDIQFMDSQRASQAWYVVANSDGVYGSLPANAFQADGKKIVFTLTPGQNGLNNVPLDASKPLVTFVVDMNEPSGYSVSTLKTTSASAISSTSNTIISKPNAMKNYNYKSDPLMDSDNDGTSDRIEGILGTDPHNPESNQNSIGITVEQVVKAGATTIMDYKIQLPSNVPVYLLSSNDGKTWRWDKYLSEKGGYVLNRAAPPSILFLPLFFDLTRERKIEQLYKHITE